MATASPLAWADLRGARVGLWGLGVEGLAAAAQLRALGVVPAAVVDDEPAGRVVAGQAVVATAAGLDALAACEVVVKTPGISRYRPEARDLRTAGVVVTGGLALWLNGADRDRVACITGSKGKSTTTAVAGHLAAGLGVRAMVGGNLGLPPFDPAAPTDVDLWLVETSSYQAADLDLGPATTAVTALSPDHLPWHEGSLERYYADKLRLCSLPGVAVTVAPTGDADLRERVGAAAAGRLRWVDPVPAGGWAEGLGLAGAHNRADAAVAAAVLAELGVDGADDADRLEVASRGFRGLPSRLEVVARRGGVTFVDDGLSTNVLATTAAVEAFAERRVALLLGGAERDLAYGPLGEHLAAAAAAGHRVLAVVMLDTACGARMADELGRAGVEVAAAADLESAVATGSTWAAPDGVVLLSPAAPSFGTHADYVDRGRAFRAAARSVGATAS